MTQAQPPGELDAEQQRQLKVLCMDNLLATAAECVYFKDALSRFIFVSVGFTTAHAPGRMPADVVGKTDFDLFTYEHAAVARQDEQQIIATGRPIIGKLERETKKNRPDAWVSTTKMPLRDERGRIVGTFGISRDITAQIRASQAQPGQR